ncbi:MAG TPA: gephyrin-like molybdotransferase Glp [Gaiellaceae bacterium]
MSELLTVDQAIARVVEHARPRGTEQVGIGQAHGRVLAEDARAGVDVPPFDSSAMDGYAVRADDTPGELTVVDRSAAGVPASRELGSGEAIGISTGAVVPGGADAVIEVERVMRLPERERDDRVTVQRVERAANIRPRGGDVAAGTVVVETGTRLAPPHIGALAAAGAATVSCARRPTVAVLSTGSELRAPGDALAPGQIYESNSLLLAAQLATAGIDADLLEAVADDEAALRFALERGLQADVLLTSGGVSVGPHDLLKRLFDELGVQRVFWGVAVRPGKPLFFGTRGESLVFGLPGNPVSTLVGFELFVRTALRACEGETDPRPRFLPGRLASALRRNGQRDDFVRARARPGDGGVLVEPVGGQESHMIVRAAAANALAFVPRGDGELRAGDNISYLELH